MKFCGFVHFALYVYYITHSIPLLVQSSGAQKIWYTANHRCLTRTSITFHWVTPAITWTTAHFSRVVLYRPAVQVQCSGWYIVFNRGVNIATLKEKPLLFDLLIHVMVESQVWNPNSKHSTFFNASQGSLLLGKDWCFFSPLMHLHGHFQDICKRTFLDWSSGQDQLDKRKTGDKQLN